MSSEMVRALRLTPERLVVRIHLDLQVIKLKLPFSEDISVTYF